MNLLKKAKKVVAKTFSITDPALVILSKEHGHALCELCTKIIQPLFPLVASKMKGNVDGWGADPERYGKLNGPHHKCSSSLALAVQKSCYICTVIDSWAGSSFEANEHYTWRGFHTGWKKATKDGFRRPTQYLLCFYKHQKDTEDVFCVSRIRLFGSKGISSLREAAAVSLQNIAVEEYTTSSTTTGHPMLLRLASTWLKECRHLHPNCDAHRDPSFSPNRLIDVELGKLVLTIQNEPVEYATLSYRWGKNPQFTTLTTDNLSEFCTSLPKENFPAVFHETMMVTRSLGLRYLWIDALCIIKSGEKSVKDWQVESAQIDRIYTNCVFNISASRAPNPIAGCFRPRDRWVKPGFNSISPLRLKRENDSVMLELFEEDVDILEQELSQSPLTKRGWILQERLLSPRILTFGQNRTFWECKEVKNISDLDQGIDGDLKLLDVSYQKHEAINFDSSLVFRVRTFWICALYSVFM